MAISLNAVELSRFLQVPDWYTAAGASGGERKTLGGVSVVTRTATGRRVTLIAKRDGNRLYGLFTRSDVELVRGLAETGAEALFIYHGEQAMVIVPLDGYAFEPVREKSDQQPGDIFVGSVSLDIVG